MIPDELIAAKMIAFHTRPYFGAALNALVMVECSSMEETLGVDKHWRCYYHPNVVKKWSPHQLAGVLTHEIGHLLREHHDRAERYGSLLQQRAWNIATDCEINDDLINEVYLHDVDGHRAGSPLTPLPNFEGQDMPLCPRMLGFKDGQFAETYYDLLLDKQSKKKKKEQGGDGDAQDGSGDPTQGNCGSCCDGKARHYEAPAPMDGADGVPPGLSPAEAELIKRETAAIMEDYKSDASRIGNLPAGWQRWVKNYLKARVNYLKYINAAIRNAYAVAAGRTDFTWTKRGRRSGAYGSFKMPGMQSFEPAVGMIVDTSGSMSDTQESQCLAEIQRVRVQLLVGDLLVTSCDAAADTVKRVMKIDDVRLIGGGGTDMGAGLAVMATAKPRRDLTILLTDCETPWPAQRPFGAIVVVQIGGSGQPPPWPCKHIKIEPGEPMDGGIAR